MRKVGVVPGNPTRDANSIMKPKEFKTEQEEFWARKYARDYIKKNESFDKELGIAAWQTMLRKARGVRSCLEWVAT